jgi:DNA polymerase-3 subunit alpha
LRYGTLSPDALITLALKHDVDTVVLTDINNTSGLPDFVRAARMQGLRPLGGVDIRVGMQQFVIAIARNNEGLREINQYLTEVNWKQREQRNIPDFSHVHLVWPFENIPNRSLNDNEWIGVRPEHVRKLMLSKWHYMQERLVVLHTVSFANASEYQLHQSFRAIDENTLLGKMHDSQFAKSYHCMLHPKKIREVFADYPQIVANTLSMMNDCCLHFDNSVKNKKQFSGSLRSDRNLLFREAFSGLEYRFGSRNFKVRQRLDHELEIIEKMEFSAYFLITWDMVRFSKSRGFYHVGRGSGANSLVAYCLGITDVDPIELDLYFERFLNPKRSTPPDFDIDYSWTDRDEVLRYLFDKYGPNHIALLGAMSTFKSRSALRELGKVYGLPKEEIDKLSKNPAAFGNKDAIHRNIVNVAAQMADFPNLRTIHAGGVLISEHSIYYYTALDMPPKGFPTTQWDMYTAEDIGFEKLDVLSQRGIGHICESVEIILKNRGERVDVHDVVRFKKDEQVRKQLKSGETIGCFYIESPAMRGLLKKLSCSDYLTLVAASSIIRPGVAKSGMMSEYIRRFHDPDGFTYPHPIMEQQLKETYGVMVYQEDVLKVCYHFAGLDLADADVLRRAMSGKYRSRNEFQRIVDRFFASCRQLGHPDELVEDIWRQIESFAGYSFSKAHSASYAVESFQSLYLKAYYPLEFMVAVINNFGGFYQSWVYFFEAHRCGANICLPCVNHSEYKSCLLGKDLYVGFIHIDSLEREIAQRIVQERLSAGVFLGIEDFIFRTGVGKAQINILIRVGAFRFTGKSRAELLWNAYSILGVQVKKQVAHAQLFHVNTPEYQLPAFKEHVLERAYDEIELVGFPVSVTWFDMLRTSFRGEVMADNLMQHVGKTVRMVGLFVTLKYVYTSRKEIMNFVSWLDVKGGFFDSVHFPDSLKYYPFRGSGLYLLLGKVVEEFGHPSLEVKKMAKLPLKPDPREEK